MILEGRCGSCGLFKGNAKKCPDDSFGREILYANDYKCKKWKRSCPDYLPPQRPDEFEGR